MTSASLPPGLVHVVTVDLDQPAAVIARLDATLAPDELDVGPASRVARAACRAALGRALGLDPAAVPISRQCARCGHPAHGRPVVEGDAVSFSVSHSATVALVAIAGGAVRLGVDVEVVRSRPRLEQLAARALEPDAFLRWQARPAAEQLEEFLRAWTAKEAYLKAIGIGIATSLRDVPAAPDGWTVRAIDAPAGAVAALAVELPDTRVQYDEWTPVL